jgi:hypothetical protein
VLALLTRSPSKERSAAVIVGTRIDAFTSPRRARAAGRIKPVITVGIAGRIGQQLGVSLARRSSRSAVLTGGHPIDQHPWIALDTESNSHCQLGKPLGCAHLGVTCAFG